MIRLMESALLKKIKTKNVACSVTVSSEILIFLCSIPVLLLSLIREKKNYFNRPTNCDVGNFNCPPTFVNGLEIAGGQKWGGILTSRLANNSTVNACYQEMQAS